MISTANGGASADVSAAHWINGRGCGEQQTSGSPVLMARVLGSTIVPPGSVHRGAVLNALGPRDARGEAFPPTQPGLPPQATLPTRPLDSVAPERSSDISTTWSRQPRQAKILGSKLMSSVSVASTSRAPGIISPREFTFPNAGSAGPIVVAPEDAPSSLDLLSQGRVVCERPVDREELFHYGGLREALPEERRASQEEHWHQAVTPLARETARPVEARRDAFLDTMGYPEPQKAPMLVPASTRTADYWTTPMEPAREIPEPVKPEKLQSSDIGGFAFASTPPVPASEVEWADETVRLWQPSSEGFGGDFAGFGAAEEEEDGAVPTYGSPGGGGYACKVPVVGDFECVKDAACA